MNDRTNDKDEDRPDEKATVTLPNLHVTYQGT